MNSEYNRDCMITDFGEEAEIDIIDMLYHVFSKWRAILAVCVLFAALFGAFKYLSLERSRAENDALIAEGKADEVIYPSDYAKAAENVLKQEQKIQELTVKITNKRAETARLTADIKIATMTITSKKDAIKIMKMQLEDTQRQLKVLEGYIADSSLMRLQAESSHTAKRVYHIVLNGDPAVIRTYFRDPADEIASAYASDIDTAQIAKQLSSKYGISEKFAEELYSVMYNTDSNTVTVLCRGKTKAMAADVLSAVCRTMEKKTGNLAERYHDHKLNVVSTETFEKFDEGMADSQNMRYEQAVDYCSQIESINADIASCDTQIANSESDIETKTEQIADANREITQSKQALVLLKNDLPELKEIKEAKTPSQTRSARAAVKFAIIGFLAGGFVMCGLYAARYCFRGRLNVGSDITSYFALPIIAELNVKRRAHECFIDRLILQIFGKLPVMSDEQIMEKAAAFTASVTKPGDTVALVSSCACRRMQNIADTLAKYAKECTFTQIADLATSAESIKKFNTCTIAICVEERGISRMNDIGGGVQLAARLNKKLLGAIVL